MLKQYIPVRASARLSALMLLLGLVACILIANPASAGKGNKGGGGDDIILYNGNIVLRGNGGKGKGKGGGGGSIVVANSAPQQMDYFPMWAGGYRRRR